jgi:hypothetical protein
MRANRLEAGAYVKDTKFLAGGGILEKLPLKFEIKQAYHQELTLP